MPEISSPIISAENHFLIETVRLLLTHNYLLTIHLSTEDQGSNIYDLHQELTTRLKPNYSSPHAYVLAQLFISHISAFEIFIQEIVAAVITKHPMKVGSTQFKLSDFLDAESKAELIERATEEYLNKIMYHKPLDYFNHICSILSIKPSPLMSQWKIFIEAKARRDIGVHNAWKCNTTYIRKLNEADIPSDAKIGDLLLPDSQTYIVNVINTLKDLAANISANVRKEHAI